MTANTPPEQKIRDVFNRLRGKYAGYVEALMLEERTERALISQMKALSYDAERDAIAAIPLKSRPGSW